MTGGRNRIKKSIFKVMTVLGILVILICMLYFLGSSDCPPDYPDYEMLNLDEVLNAGQLYQNGPSKEQSKMLFEQTGLGERAVKELIENSQDYEEMMEELKKYQNQLFFGTGEKEIVSLEDGDVLISISQRMCFYVHGHAAMVTDAKNLEILEAKSFKAGSCMGSINRWTGLSSFAILRVKEDINCQKEGSSISQAAARYAKDNLNGLKYSLFKNLKPDKSALPEYTQCAHLVWYAYYRCGLDIDENKRIIIKPKDFLISDTFDVIQVYGINPKTITQMRNE